jgi:hypothetical protein
MITGDDMSREESQEASIPVASRVNVISLANLLEFFEKEHGRVRSMSQLIDWSIELLAEILLANKKIEVPIIRVLDAHKLMIERELYQKSLEKRSFQKIGTAIRFESMREEGSEVSSDTVGAQYKILHNRRSVDPLNKGVESGRDMADWEKAKLAKQTEIYNENRKRKELAELRKAGIIVDDPDKPKVEWTPAMAPRKLTDEEIAANNTRVIENDKEYLRQLNEDPAKQIEELKRLGKVVKE